jgi:putative phosphoribosyl transferase
MARGSLRSEWARAAHPALEVHVQVRKAVLRGDLTVPPGAHGVVLFAHGSGSSRHSPRNRYIAQVLQDAGLATLLIDLLSPAEEAREAAGAGLRLDINALAERLSTATTWLSRAPATRNLPVAFFGASTGAAAAMVASLYLKRGEVQAIVARGGRPDLVSPELLARVSAPTLLVVGSRDTDVLALNGQAYAHLRCERRFQVIRGASHLFEEPGSLDQVAVQARDWLLRHITRRRS